MLEMEWWRRLEDMYGYGMLYWHALLLAIVKDTWGFEQQTLSLDARR